MAKKNFFDFQEKLPSRSASPAVVPDGAGALSVAQVTALIERAIKSLPAPLLVRGQVSNFKPHAPSGHLYFTLKDAFAALPCVMWKSDAVRVKFAPEDGMELLASGRLGVFAPQGKYQLYVTSLAPLGKGALELAFQQLRAKLEAAGLFQPERKKPLPDYPLRIALVTSLQTAALQDMLKVLRRFSWLELMIYHVPVQGEGAGPKIAAALDHLSRCRAQVGGVDLILLARGGGSLEDLWEFNHEAVARAIAGSAIPVITGIGHEVATSIADLVADYHAHTPTEAAQIAVRNWRNAKDNAAALGVRLGRGLRSLVQQARQRLDAVERHEFFRHPLERIVALRNLLDDRQRALTLAFAQRTRDVQQRISALAAALRERHPRHMIQLHRQRMTSLAAVLRERMAHRLRRHASRLDALRGRIDALNPLQVLRRGFSITTVKKTGQVVRISDQVKPGDRLLTRLSDGKIQSIIEDSAQLLFFDEAPKSP